MARVDETARAGIRAYPMCSPNRVTQDFTMKNCQVFRGLPTWHPILISSDEEKLRAYADPEVRDKLHDEAVERSGADLGRHRVLEDLVELHVGQRAGAGEEQVDAVQDDRRDRQDAEQAGDRRVPRPGGRGEARNPLPAGREQHRRRGDEEDPDLSERDHRAGRRRRARAVPRRLRLHHAAARRVGAREAGDDPGAGGAAADLRVGLDCSASTTAACCARAWRRTS